MVHVMEKPVLQIAVVVVAVATIALALYLLLPLFSPGSTQQSIVINGAGATFPAPQVLEWAKRFSMETGITVEYNPVGSGAGRAMLFNKTVLFAFSDPPLERDLYLEYQGKILQIPVVIGAIAISYNIPELPKNIHLNLTGELLALIYKGEISKWSDERIKRVNPEVASLLPDKDIVVVHRTDSSGTTRIFTGYLHKVAPSIWGSDLVGFTVDWPVDKLGRGLGGKGNEGVAQLIQQTPYSIGYVETGYALAVNMPIAKLMNRDGYYTLPTRESVLSALENAVSKLPDSPLDDFSMDLDVALDAPGSNSYPIAAFSHMVLYAKYDDPLVAKALADFIRFIVTKGQQYLLPGYYPLPDRIVSLGLKAAEILEKTGG